MNQYFNFTRFGRVLRQHTTEHLTSYLLSTAVLAGGILVVLGTLTYLTRRPLERELQIVLFDFGLLAAGLLFTASVFAALGSPRGAAPALLLPASHLEKYLVAWLWSLPVFVVLYTGIFMLINLAVLQLASQGQPYEVYDFSHGAREWATPLLSYALLHSVALCGAIYFQRLHIIKTAFWVFGTLAVLLIANRQLLKIMLPGSSPIAPFGDVWVGEGRQHALLTLPTEQWHLALMLLPVALAVLLWLAAYTRLTEKQI
ncbi:MAG: hypothetical protein EOO56_12150 [Hymenobacter sp.]|nr:MAG: hypothetical protein EOO56_12150 [Hymenobacter sp.]